MPVLLPFFSPISMLHTPYRFTPLIDDSHADCERMFVFHPEGVMLREADLSLPEAAMCRELDALDGRVHTVGMLDECLYRCMTVGRTQLPAAGYGYRTLRSLFGLWSDELLAVASRASQIAEWARSHRYCGVCGTSTELPAGERCMRCLACGQSFYPRVSPSMMVLVKKGNAILLARNGAWPMNRFSALAGFVEPGESVEEAVHREVEEEVGLRVHKLNYFGSQSWPFPHSLMLAFTAEYLSGEIKVDGMEIAEARWFEPGDILPDIPTRISISSALIQANLPVARR
jgi:NAD+ diphosphatase